MNKSMEPYLMESLNEVVCSLKDMGVSSEKILSEVDAALTEYANKVIPPTFKPDSWVVIKFCDPDKAPYYKLLAGWHGNNLYKADWRINSGIIEAEVKEDCITFKGASGSVYECHKGGYRLIPVTAGIVEQIKEIKAVEVLEEDTNWGGVEWV